MRLIPLTPECDADRDQAGIDKEAKKVDDEIVSTVENSKHNT
jgi:hypothetical protein